MKTTLLLLILFCFSLAGCQKPAANETRATAKTAASKPPGPDPAAAKPFLVKESVYVVHPSKLDDSIYVLWTAVLQNPNPDLFGESPVLTITARDETGSVVGTEDQMFNELTPGGIVAFSGQIEATKTPKTVDFTVGKTRWKAAPKPAAAYPAIMTQGVSMKLDQISGGYVVVGEFLNPYPFPLDSTVVTALFRDETGRLIGGKSTFVDNAPANGARPFNVNHVGLEGKPAKVDVIVTTWAGSNLSELIK
jgi:hypothetical protein